MRSRCSPIPLALLFERVERIAEIQYLHRIRAGEQG